LLQYWWKQDWTMFCCPHCSVVNNIEQNCYILFRLNNIVQYCWQV
jgi:hypothetical protein